MNKEIKWKVNSFEELDIHTLYKIMRLRSEVFVLEQKSIYLDLDNKDQKALHLQGFIGEELVAYCRLFYPGDYFDEACIGRVVTPKKYRKHRYGWRLLEKAIKAIEEQMNESVITISAQFYLKGFYESHGFKQISEEYLEDGIPHIRMKKG